MHHTARMFPVLFAGSDRASHWVSRAVDGQFPDPSTGLYADFVAPPRALPTDQSAMRSAAAARATAALADEAAAGRAHLRPTVHTERRIR